MKKSKTTKPKNRAVVSKSFGVRSLKPNNRLQWLGIALFALVAAALLYRSFANPIYSSKPGDIVLQYVQPHNDITAVDRLSSAHYSPFTLYGNGLLVCGQNDPHQYDAPNQAAVSADHAETQPTARTLSNTEMSALVQNVRDTGFESLDSEYFNMPISQNQYTVRLITKGSEKVVLYYNDVTPPAAYTQTLAIMKDACAKTTQPYISGTATVRARANVDVTGKAVDPIDAYDQQPADTLKSAMNKGKAVKSQNDAKRAADQQVEDSDEQSVTVSGTTAEAVQKATNGQPTKFINFEGTNYEVAVDPELPQANNPLDIDYNKVRAETNKKKSNEGKSLTARALESIDPSQKALAQTTGGYRVVLLLSSDGGSTAQATNAQTFAGRANTWMCNKVGKCPTYKGFSIIRGSQTLAYYNSCHVAGTCNGNQMYNIFYNVAYKDQNTIYRSDVATLVIPGWKTNTLSTSGPKACGLGAQPGTLSVIDLYQTTTVNGLSCDPLAKSFPHEYIHNKGVGHNGSCTNRYLMDGPPGCSHSNDCHLAGTTYPICILTSAQSTFLRGSASY